MVEINEDGIVVSGETMAAARRALSKAKRIRAKEDERFEQWRREAATLAYAEIGRCLVHDGRLKASQLVTAGQSGWEEHVSVDDRAHWTFSPGIPGSERFSFVGYRPDAFLEAPNGEARFCHVVARNGDEAPHWLAFGETEHAVSCVPVPRALSAMLPKV